MINIGFVSVCICVCACMFSPAFCRLSCWCVLLCVCVCVMYALSVPVFDVCVRASSQPKAELTDSFPPRSPLVFLIDRHNAEVQALSLVPMLIAASCIFMSSRGIKQLNKG